MMSYTAPGPSGMNFESLAHAGIQLNGSFEFRQAQEAAVTLTAPATNDVADCWRANAAGSFVATFDFDTADVPSGFRSCAKITVGTAQVSLGATDNFTFFQPIEGSRLMRLGFGTSGAQYITLCFWVKAHRIGQYGGVVKNTAANRVYGFGFLVNVADTWEFKTVTIVGDTTGTWPIAAATGAYVEICLASGASNLIAANAWGTTNAHSITGQVNAVGAVTDVFRFTGFCIIPGAWNVPSTGSSRLMRMPTEEFPLLQRYYEKTYSPGTAPGTVVNTDLFVFSSGANVASALVQASFPYKVTKRAIPTITFYDLAGAAGKITITLTTGGATSGITPSTGAFAAGMNRVSILHNDATAFYSGFYCHVVMDARLT